MYYLLYFGLKKELRLRRESALSIMGDRCEMIESLWTNKALESTHHSLIKLAGLFSMTVFGVDLTSTHLVL